MKSESKTILLSMLGYSSENLKKKTADFQENMATDPAYALEWSNGLFNAAAENRAARALSRMVEAGADLPELMEFCLDFALQSQGVSSSPTTNIINDAEISAYARFYKNMKGL